MPHVPHFENVTRMRNTGNDNLICALNMAMDCVSSEQTDEIPLLSMDFNNLHRIGTRQSS